MAKWIKEGHYWIDSLVLNFIELLEFQDLVHTKNKSYYKAETDSNI